MIRLAIHGGAGVIERENMGAEAETRYRDALKDITSSTLALLQGGASAMDAVEHAVRMLENCPLFNAGFGGVLNADGEVEMDAAIMDGTDRSCGAVAAVRNVRHPISVARAVADRTEHVMLAGDAAWRFAATDQQELCQPGDLVTDDRRMQLASARRSGRVSLDHDEATAVQNKMGTVGAVARDDRGRLAAATSTGGMTNKLPGRVGDSPLIGAGTWADNETCAVSGTGHGEFFIRVAVAYDLHARITYGHEPLRTASAASLERVAKMGGSGGLIAIDQSGKVELAFNSPGMYRGWVDDSGMVRVAIYGDEDGI